MCQVCPIPACPSRYNSRGEVVEPEPYKEEEEDEGEYCPPSPPRVIDEKTIVQPAPSHDGAATFAAYRVPTSTPETEAEIRPLRPPFTTVIYDATHTACPTRSARFVRALFDGTLDDRTSRDWLPDRFEVITLPLPQSFSDDERVDACIRHHEKEIQSRLRMADKAEATSWSLPERIMNRRYARMILVINRFEADDDKNNDGEVAPWEEALRIEDILSGGKMHPDANRFGSYLQVQWQRREQLEDAYLDPKYISPDLSFRDFGFGVFGRTLFEMFTPAVPFYNHFVPDGVLNRQLEEARESLVDFDALTI